jgi:phage baseplate assembly protein W
MIGTDATTGKALDGIAHLRQSIRDILTTPVGTRVMLRDYGSRLFQLIDAPMNSSTLLAIYTAAIEAIEKWEPRLRVSSVSASDAKPGQITLDIVGTYLPDGKEVTLNGVVVN